jgi:biopolymer transport protein ExbD
MTKISLTPVIDVVFILLIFFMLASNFNKVGEVNMDMTKESNTSSKEDIKIIKLLVRQDQTVLSEGKVYDDSELLIMLNMAIKDTERYSIILTSKDDVTYQRFLNLISHLKINELNNVSIGIKKNEIDN